MILKKINKMDRPWRELSRKEGANMICQQKGSDNYRYNSYKK